MDLGWKFGGGDDNDNDDDNMFMLQQHAHCAFKQNKTKNLLVHSFRKSNYLWKGKSLDFA